MNAHNKKTIFLLSLLLFFIGSSVGAQNININVNNLLAKVEVSFSPRSGSFEEGSTFQVPILINTKGSSINGIDIRIKFDKDKLSIVNSTGGTSIIGVWVEPPQFDNAQGTAKYVGVVTGGITTEAGLIGTITFEAKAPGDAIVSIGSNSKILLNDGLGTEAETDLGMGKYTILAKAPEGVQIYSETHPIQSEWYNNNSPVISWIKDPGVDGFSFVLDNKPNTIPDNIVDSSDTVKSFESLNDGLYYFHIKAKKGDIWGTTGNFLLRIDTTPPAEFRPQINYLLAAAALTQKTLVSFFTTDNLSGVDHYEVGVIDKNQPPTESPVFVQTESPYLVPLASDDKLQVIVRAVDRAGNVRDESIDVRPPSSFLKLIQDYPIYILIGIVMLGFIILALYSVFGHHVVHHVRRLEDFVKRRKI